MLVQTVWERLSIVSRKHLGSQILEGCGSQSEAKEWIDIKTEEDADKLMERMEHFHD